MMELSSPADLRGCLRQIDAEERRLKDERQRINQRLRETTAARWVGRDIDLNDVTTFREASQDTWADTKLYTAIINWYLAFSPLVGSTNGVYTNATYRIPVPYLYPSAERISDDALNGVRNLAAALLERYEPNPNSQGPSPILDGMLYMSAVDPHDRFHGILELYVHPTEDRARVDLLTRGNSSPLTEGTLREVIEYLAEGDEEYA